MPIGIAGVIASAMRNGCNRHENSELVPLDARQMRVKQVTQGQLARRRQVDEVAVVIQEQSPGIGTKLGSKKQTLDAQLALGEVDGTRVESSR